MMEHESVVLDWFNFDDSIVRDWHFKTTARVVRWRSGNRVIARN
jgi:hypothetical protein